MISSIKWKNHSILGDLELDLTDGNGHAYDTIILAGENGTGKTTILETLSSFLSLGSFIPFDYIHYTIGKDEYKIYYEEDDRPEYGFHKRYSLTNGKKLTIYSNKSNDAQSIKEDLSDIRHYGVSYSKARSGFKTNAIKSSTTEQLENCKYNNDELDDFTNIKQLLVDLAEQDNAEWMRISRTHPNAPLVDYETDFKLYRFEKAFNSFFDRLKFKEIDETDPIEKAICFEKSGKRIKIDSLSTGEKQIVFRGAQLLRNINSVNGGLVLVDEPELSLHPSWQEKILDYYRNLYTVDNHQIAQMIFATHSEYILRKALQDRGNVLIIVLSEKDGIISSRNIIAPSVLPTITAAETNYLAFNIISVDYHIQLYGYLQQITNTKSIVDCDTFIKKHSLFDVSKHGRNSSFRTSEYETLCTYIRNAIDHPDSGHSYTEEELKTSIELLIDICNSVNKK